MQNWGSQTPDFYVRLPPTPSSPHTSLFNWIEFSEIIDKFAIFMLYTLSNNEVEVK